MGAEKEIIGEGRHLRLVRRGKWEYAERTRGIGVVAMVAVTPAGALLLVEQMRPAVGGVVIELPAGLVGDEAEDTTANDGASADGDASADDDAWAGARPADPAGYDGAFAAAAARELREETGWEAARWEWLTAGPTSSGLSSEVIHFYRGRDLRRSGDGGGIEGESITVHEVPLEGIEAWLAARRAEGRAIDPRIYIGLYFAGR